MKIIIIIFLFKRFFSSLGKNDNIIAVKKLESEKSLEKLTAVRLIPGFIYSKQALAHLNKSNSDDVYTLDDGILELLYFCWISGGRCFITWRNFLCVTRDK